MEELAPGSRVGPYELLKLAGSGGQASVWRATLLGPSGYTKAVALKVLSEGSAGNLQREHRLGGLVGHPNVVEVYDTSQHQGFGYLALEWVDGPSVADRVREAALPPRAVADLGAGIASALDHVHRRGVVHRDVSPGNVLITANGVPKLSDLGLALYLDEASTSERAGTPGYAAPEQVRGEALDGRADVFALGALLFLAASGRPLLARTWMHDDRALAAARERVAASLATAPELARAINEMISFSPADRPSAAEVHKTLRRLAVPGRTLVQCLAPDVVSPVPMVAHGNIPSSTDPFFGREAERAWLKARLEEQPVGVLTIHGTGGIGKTRLVTEVVSRVDPPGGCWFVDLAATRSELEIASAVATSLGLAFGRGGSEAVSEALDSRPRMVLVLDNAEHVVQEVAALVEEWAHSCLHHLVVTSREPLGILGERVLSVGPTTTGTQHDLLESRARNLGWDGSGDVGALLERLDGIPLAIELTAALVAERGVAGAEAALLDSHEGGHGLHPAMMSALQASWVLLGEHERSALAQWSVFEGGFTAESADAVLELSDDAPWSLDLLDALLRKGLLAEQEGESVGDPRFGLYVPVQQFVRSRFHGQLSAAEVRHGRLFAQLDERLDATVIGRTERANARVALERAVGRGDAAVATHACHLLWVGYAPTGPLAMASEAVELALTCPGLEPAHLANLHYTRGAVALNQGRMDAARVDLEAAVELAEALGLEAKLAASHNILGSLHLLQQRSEQAVHYLSLACEEYGALGDWQRQGAVLSNLGTLRFNQGNLDQALDFYTQSLELLARAGDRVREAAVIGNLGLVYEALNRLPESKEALTAAIDLHKQLGSRRSEGISTGNLGHLYRRLGDYDGAVRLLQQALEIHEEVGNVRSAAIAVRSLAEAYAVMGRTEEARTALRRALKVSREVGNRIEIAMTLMSLARVDSKHVEAFSWLDEARAIAEELELDETRLSVLIARVNVLLDRNEQGAARTLWQTRLPDFDPGAVSRGSELYEALENVESRLSLE